MTRLYPLLILLLLAACGGNKQVQLHYAPTVAVAPGSGKAYIGPVADQRGEPDPNWVGRVEGGYGNAVAQLRGDQPAADMVRQAFNDGLAARGMLAQPGSGARELRIAVRQLDVDQFNRKEARLDLALDVIGASGQPIYHDEVKLNPVRGSLITFEAGIFADTDKLRDLLAQTLSQAVDQMLDKPGFRQAVQTSGGRVS